MSRRLTLEEFINRVEKIHDGRIEVMGEYINNRTKTDLRCRVCGNIWKSRPFHTFNHRGCPECAPRSKGERVISEYLDDVGLPYIREYKFDDLMYRNPLRYDFAVFDPDTLNLEHLIEFDGVHHYEPITYWGGSRLFKEIKIRDKLKDHYARANSIPLLRIPYYRIDHIHPILEEGLVTDEG